jgi:hypothetical protein
MALWRSGYAEVCKTFYTGSIPVSASIKAIMSIFAWVVELVYTFDLKSNALKACGFESRPRHQVKL